MIPVITSDAPALAPRELAMLAQLERVAARSPAAASAAAELACVPALAVPLLECWTENDMAANEGQLLRRLAPWVAIGLPPRHPMRGESAAQYAQALDDLSLTLSMSTMGHAVRELGRQLRRFAREPEVASLLAKPEVARVGLLASPSFLAVVPVVRALAERDPRPLATHATTEAGADPIDWEAENRRMRDERNATESATRASFYKKTAELSAAYASACVAFPVLAAAAPAVGIAIAAGVAAFEGIYRLAKWWGAGDANSPAQIARVVTELRFWTDTGLPPLPFDGELWQAQGYANTLRWCREWLMSQPPAVRQPLLELGSIMQQTGTTSAVANAAITRLSLGPMGYGPIYPGLVAKNEPLASKVATPMGEAVARVLATYLQGRGWASPEAQMRQAAIDAYRAALTDKSIAMNDTYGRALAASFAAALSVAKAGVKPLPASFSGTAIKLTAPAKLSTATAATTATTPPAASNSSSGPLVLGAAALAALVLSRR